MTAKAGRYKQLHQDVLHIYSALVITLQKLEMIAKASEEIGR